MKKYTLKVYPVGLGREVYRVMEISGEHTLDDLCDAILTSFDFDDDHLYEFCMDNKMYSENNYVSAPLEEDDPSTNISLDTLGLMTRQKFTLHYDFGDDWLFAINVRKIEETSWRVAPTVLQEKGRVEQYPDWDDEEL